MRCLQYSILMLAGVLAAGGWQFAPTIGFFRLSAGTAPVRLIAPDGQPFLLRAVDHVHLISASAPRTDLAPAYVDQRSAAIITGLRAWGFNALGGDTDADIWHRGLPFIELLGISAHLQANQQTPLFDVYAPDFPAQVQTLVQAACAPEVNDHDLIGYLSDAGLSWDPAENKAAPVLSYYLELPVGTPGRQRAQDYLRVRYGSDIRRLNRAWGEKASDFIALTLPAANAAQFDADAAPFAQQILVRYLQVVANAIHAADPNHLDLGAELKPGDSAPAWTIPDLDAVRLSPAQDPQPMVAALPKPVLAVEDGCGPVSASTRALLSIPAVVGYIWNLDGDWQSGACAAQATSAWAKTNTAAPTGP